MQYTNEVKRDAMLMIGQGTKIAEVSQLLDVPASTLYRWRSETQRPDPKPQQADSTVKIQELAGEFKSQVDSLKEEVFEKILALELEVRALHKELAILRPVARTSAPKLPTRSKHLPEAWSPAEELT